MHNPNIFVPFPVYLGEKITPELMQQTEENVSKVFPVCEIVPTARVHDGQSRYCKLFE